jgi:hypothetical protein
MACQLTSLGVTVLAHGYPQFGVTRARIDTLDDDAAANAVGDPAAFDYLLATTQAEVSWLRGFANSMRSGQPRRQQTDGMET